MDIGVMLALCAVAGFVSTTAWAATIAAFFVVGSIGFWGLLVVPSIIILVALEHDREFTAFLAIVAMGLMLQLYSGVGLVPYVLHNPSSIFWLALTYLAAGTVWSFFKWYLHCRDERKRLDEYNRRKKKGTSMYGFGGKPEKPIAADSKSRITGWMTLWPWSLVWFIINDPVRRAFNAIYEKFSGAYQKISDKAFEGAKDKEEAGV